MQQVMYALQFTGTGTPRSGSDNVLAVTSSADSAVVTTVAGPGGISGNVHTGPGDKATFSSEVTIGAEGTFEESGTIEFGNGGNKLRFSTIGRGFMAPSADAGVQHGAIIWRVDGGEGQFDGATGIITSNFTVNEASEVTDNQFGLIFVK